jgi:hypothetical protein
MPASVAGRLTLDDLADSNNARRAPAPADDDSSISAISAAAADADDISVLAGLYHRARIATAAVSAQFDDAVSEAERMYPDPPSEIRGQGQGGPSSAIRPEQDWPTWRREIYHRWKRQCCLIDKGLGVEAAQEALDAAVHLTDDLAERAIAAEAKTASAIATKLGVCFWRIKNDGLTADETSAVLQQLQIDLDRLAAQETQLA